MNQTFDASNPALLFRGAPFILPVGLAPAARTPDRPLSSPPTATGGGFVGWVKQWLAKPASGR